MRFAKRVADKLGENVHLIESQAGQHPVYRVQVGPIANVDQSDLMHQQIKQAGLGEAILLIQ